MSQTTEASSAASSQADVGKGSGNLTQGQAAAQLIAQQLKAADAKPATEASEKIAPVEAAPAADTEQTETAPDAEANAASVDADSEEQTGEQAAAETSEAEAQDSEDDADSAVLSQPLFTPEQQKAFDKAFGKRIDKEVAKRTALEDKLAAAEARLSQLGGSQQQSTPEQTAPTQTAAVAPSGIPLAQVNDQAALDNIRNTAKGALRWAEEILDTPRAWKTRVETDPETGGETETRITQIGDKAYTEADVKGILRHSKIMLEDQIPMRRDYLAARSEAQKVARSEFPFLADKESQDYAWAQNLLRDPLVAHRPDAEWIVGVQIMGMKALQQAKVAAKAAADGKTVKPKTQTARPSGDQAAAPVTTGATRTPVSTASRQAEVRHDQELRKKGGITAAEAIASLQFKDRLRNSR